MIIIFEIGMWYDYVGVIWKWCIINVINVNKIWNCRGV